MFSHVLKDADFCRYWVMEQYVAENATALTN